MITYCNNFFSNNFMMETLKKMDSVVFLSINTTSRSNKSDIIEISGFRCHTCPYSPYDVFHTYIQTSLTIKKEVTERTGIDNQMLEGQETIDSASIWLKNYLKPGETVFVYTPCTMKRMILHFQDTIPFLKDLPVIYVRDYVKDFLCLFDVDGNDMDTAAAVFHLNRDLKSSIRKNQCMAGLMNLFSASMAEISAAEKKKRKVSVNSICYYAMFKRKSRIYVNTTAGTIFYEQVSSRWKADDADPKDLDMVNLEKQIRNLFMTDPVTSITDILSSFKGKISIDRYGNISRQENYAPANH